MRPGFLGNTSYWFNGLGGEYFEVEEVHSAQPTYHLRDKVWGKTGRETKARTLRTWTTLPIPKTKLADKYQLAPYGRRLNIRQLIPIEWRL